MHLGHNPIYTVDSLSYQGNRTKNCARSFIFSRFVEKLENRRINKSCNSRNLRCIIGKKIWFSK